MFFDSQSSLRVLIFVLGLSYYGEVESSNIGPSGGSTTIPTTAIEFIEFLVNPDNDTVAVGETATFTVECNGTPDVIQWYESTNNGATWSV